MKRKSCRPNWNELERTGENCARAAAMGEKGGGQEGDEWLRE